MLPARVAWHRQKCTRCPIKRKKGRFIVALHAASWCASAPTFSRGGAPAVDKELIAAGRKCGAYCSGQHWRFFFGVFADPKQI